MIKLTCAMISIYVGKFPQQIAYHSMDRTERFKRFLAKSNCRNIQEYVSFLISCVVCVCVYVLSDFWSSVVNFLRYVVNTSFNSKASSHRVCNHCYRLTLIIVIDHIWCRDSLSKPILDFVMMRGLKSQSGYIFQYCFRFYLTVSSFLLSSFSCNWRRVY